MIRKFKSYNKTCIPAVLFMFLAISSCERDLSDEAVLATFPTTADVYTDNPVGLTQEFFESFDPAAGANPEGFGTDDNEAFLGTSSIRIDVPSPSNPNGNFVGGIFRDAGEGRDLSGYDALTFWAKASTTATIGDIGFGTDFGTNEFEVARLNIPLGTDWQKYIVPIPDASKLIQERGLFRFSAGAFDVNNTPFDPNDDIGYTFWMDEIRFENLGTIAQPRPSVFGGIDLQQNSFVGSNISVGGLSQVFNLASGQDVTVFLTQAYFDFASSDTSVAIIDNDGEISVIGAGTTLITASVNGVAADGSLQITATGALPIAPVPDLPAENVKSIFSDTYPDETIININPGFGGSTTQTTLLTFDEESVISYSNNNFTGIIFDNTVDASALSFMHIDVYVQETDVEIGIQIRDIGANQEIETNQFTGFPEGDDKDFRIDLTALNVNEWTSFEIPLSGDLASQKDNLGAVIITGGPNFILDNIYFYQE
ncbi:MAG: glycosyl hydrolase family 16 [Bacteroidota bacterium]